MPKRVKWVSSIERAGTPYQPETPREVKRDLISREVKPLKARYGVSSGVKYPVSDEVVGKPAIIEETVIQEGKPYEGQTPDTFARIEFDCLVDELQDYGETKCYNSEFGKINVAKDAIYYDVE